MPLTHPQEACSLAGSAMRMCTPALLTPCLHHLLGLPNPCLLASDPYHLKVGLCSLFKAIRGDSSFTHHADNIHFASHSYFENSEKFHF